MSVKLRLTRVGKTKQPHYRIVAADSRRARDGRFIEILGQYNPRSEPSVINVDNDKVVEWLRQGAQPTERVRKILEISGAWESFTGVKPAPRVSTKPAKPVAPATPAESAKPAASAEPDVAPAAPEATVDAEPAAEPAVEAAAVDGGAVSPDGDGGGDQ